MTPAVIEVKPAFVIPISPVTATAVGTFDPLPTMIWAEVTFSNLLKAIAAEAFRKCSNKLPIKAKMVPRRPI